MKDNVTLNYFFNKLSCFKSFNSFLDEIFFTSSSNNELNNEKKTSKFIVFYKKWFFLNDVYFYIVDTLYVYVYYYVYNKFTLLSFYKNNKVNLKLTQTKSNFIYNLSKNDYNQNLLLFTYSIIIRCW